MLYHDRIEISEGIDSTKSNRVKECMIYHYWFFNHELKFQDSVSNICHDLTKFCLNTSDITITIIKILDYRCIIHSLKLANLKQLIY